MSENGRSTLGADHTTPRRQLTTTAESADRFAEKIGPYMTISRGLAQLLDWFTLEFAGGLNDLPKKKGKGK